MSEIQGGRWDNLLRRMFSVKASSIAPAVGGELVPTVPVVPERPEDCLLRGDRLYHGRKTSTTAVGNYGFVQLMNTSANSLVIVERALCHDTTGATIVDIRMGNVQNGTTGVTIAARDTRLGITLTNKQQAGEISFGHAAAITGTAAQQVLFGGTESARPMLPIVLGPGTHVTFWDATANQVISVSLQWRERLAEPGELTVV